MLITDCAYCWIKYCKMKSIFFHQIDIQLLSLVCSEILERENLFRRVGCLTSETLVVAIHTTTLNIKSFHSAHRLQLQILYVSHRTE